MTLTTKQTLSTQFVETKKKPNEGKFYPRYEVYIRLNQVEKFGIVKKEDNEND